MKTTNEINPVLNSNPGLRQRCVSSCRKLVAQISRTKQAILNEFKQSFHASDQVLRLALNEAEALAWQTGFPHLVFPTLATEKAQAAVAWAAHQRAVRFPEQRSH